MKTEEISTLKEFECWVLTNIIFLRTKVSFFPSIIDHSSAAVYQALRVACRLISRQLELDLNQWSAPHISTHFPVPAVCISDETHS